ncbi:multiple C2 and transmembrane domain-containing protein 1-like isoform X5 [Branchiostoma floridae x Branchiostoma japonicum]
MSALGAARSDADTDSEVGERCSVSSSSPEREPGAGRKSRKQRLLGYFKKKAKPRWPFLAEKSSKSQGTTKLKRDPRLTCSQPDIAHQGYGADSPVRRPSLAPQAANGRVRGPAKTAAEPNGQTPGQNGQDCAAYAEVLPKEAGTSQDPDGATGYSPSHAAVSTSGYNARQENTTDSIPRPTARSVRHQYDFFTLDVTLKEGRRLAIRDKCGTSDPYVKFKYDGKQVHKSRIVYKNLNPRWDETFSLPVDDVTKPLVVKVFDYDRGLQDDPMGHAYIDLASLLIDRKEEFKVDLEDPHVAEDLGYLLLDLTLVPKTSDEKEEFSREDRYFSLLDQLSLTYWKHKYLAKRNRLVETQRSMKAQIWSSVVSLVLIEGKGLLPMDDNGLSDPYCKFRLGNEKYKSKVAGKTLNPRWLEQFDLHMYDDQTSVLEISVWDKDVGSKDDFMGRCQVDLSELKREETHHIEKELEDGAGSVSFLLTITGHASHAHSPTCWGADGLHTHLGSAGNETITDLANYMPDPRERLEVQRRYSLLRSLRNLNDVGLLQVKVIKATGLLAADFGGKSDPFCVLELTNARLQTQTIYKTLNPEWGKVFTFQVKDIHSILEVSVYDEDRNKSAEFLGKVAIPLLRIRNGERKAFFLKDKKLRRRTKGSIVLEMEVIYNSVKASWRTFNPKEVKYLQMEQKFKRQILVRNLQRVSRLVMAVVNTGRFVKSCFEWESKTRSITAFIMYVLMVWNFELYMLPLVLLSIFFKYYIVRSVMEGRTDQQEVRADEEAEEEEQEEDEDDEERGKEKSKSFKEKLQAIQDVCQTVQNGLDEVASLGESVKNAFNWTVPFLSWLAVITLAIATVVLYFIPLRYLVLVWGINKFTKKLRNPNAIPNNELLDFLSRVPSDEELIDCKELKSDDTQQPSPKKKKTS